MSGNDYQNSLLGVCGAGDDNTPTGAHDLTLGGKLRFRDPVRRAFTLPSILCGSFAGALSSNHLHHQDYEATATTRTRTSQDETRNDDQEYDLYASQADQDACSTSMSSQPSGKLRFWLADDEQQQSRRAITQSPSGQSLGSRSGSGKQRPGPVHSARASGRSQQPSPASSCVGGSSRRASPVSFSAFDCHDRHQKEQPMGHSGGGSGSQLSSLSCLVTPIRRVTAAPPQASTTTTSDQPASKLSARNAHARPGEFPNFPARRSRRFAARQSFGSPTKSRPHNLRLPLRKPPNSNMQIVMETTSMHSQHQRTSAPNTKTTTNRSAVQSGAWPWSCSTRIRRSRATKRNSRTC